MRPVVLTPSEWQAIRTELHTEHPASVLALRSKMKMVLGFTVREHKGWVENKNYKKEYVGWQQRQQGTSNKNDPFTILDWEPSKGNSDYQIHLDFYSEKKRTMFLLKFSDIINRSNT